MKALPVAMAIGCIQNGTIAGKLNGVIPATTPRGWRTVWASTPVETFSEKPPLRSWVMEVANSRVSRPRAISPRSEEHTSELQSRGHLVCRLLLEKKKTDGRRFRWVHRELCGL